MPSDPSWNAVEYKSQNKTGHIHTTARCNQQTVNNADSTEGYTNFSIILSLKQQIQCKIYCQKNDWIFFKNLQTIYNKFYSTQDNA